MKCLTIILLVAVSGCARQQPCPIPDTFSSLDAWQAHASNQVRSWVPLGAAAVDAQRVMEEHNFRVFTNSPALLGCGYRSQSTWRDLVEQSITVHFYLNDGKVTNEVVTTWLTGP